MENLLGAGKLLYIELEIHRYVKIVNKTLVMNAVLINMLIEYPMPYF